MKVRVEGNPGSALALMSVIALTPYFDLVGYAEGPFRVEGHDDLFWMEFEIQPAPREPQEETHP